MTELIKQRLVGMLIAVIAGVVFIPDLLDGQKNTIKEDFKKIPPRPESSESPMIREFPTAEVTEAISNAPSHSNEIASDEASLEAVGAEQSSSTDNQDDFSDTPVTSVTIEKSGHTGSALEQFESSAWVLRLGTFRNKPNVDALLNKLEEAGFTTFVKPVEAKAGTLYRVFVGPELEKSKLEKAQETLKELTGLKGKITQFEPVN